MSTSSSTLPMAAVMQRTVLVVDDNPTNLGVVSQYLQDYGYRVLTARSGMDALNRAELASPGLILLDVMMPGMDGFETCRHLKANPLTQSIPVIFMTALTETAHKVTGFAVGAVDYVTKPLHQEEVMARVETHLRLRELNAELEQKVAQRTAELDNAYQLLERLDQAKADFIQVMSHELR
ncbi:MAG: response regulator, partial [Okeania sp. SIO3B3]|nr:response regulator [Okeania sp. SIO3B3]